MYLWPTVAEAAVCWKDRATATVDVGWFWCLPPHPASCQATLAVPVCPTLQIELPLPIPYFIMALAIPDSSTMVVSFYIGAAFITFWRPL